MERLEDPDYQCRPTLVPPSVEEGPSGSSGRAWEWDIEEDPDLRQLRMAVELDADGRRIG